VRIFKFGIQLLQNCKSTDHDEKENKDEENCSIQLKKQFSTNSIDNISQPSLQQRNDTKVSEVSCSYPLSRQVIYNIFPHPHFGLRVEQRRVADDEHSVARTGEKDVDAVESSEETDIVFVVATDERNDDNVRLLALETRE